MRDQISFGIVMGFNAILVDHEDLCNSKRELNYLCEVSAWDNSQIETWMKRKKERHQQH